MDAWLRKISHQQWEQCPSELLGAWMSFRDLRTSLLCGLCYASYLCCHHLPHFPPPHLWALRPHDLQSLHLLTGVLEGKYNQGHRPLGNLLSWSLENMITYLSGVFRASRVEGGAKERREGKKWTRQVTPGQWGPRKPLYLHSCYASLTSLLSCL